MLVLICLVTFISIIPLPATTTVAQLPNCAEINQHSGWILVSTLDGKLSVLDHKNNGKVIWSLDTGPGPMLSSNIDRLELTNNGQWMRIIPSLTGSLYKFNGDTIDEIPITADSLLTASFRYLDGLVIAGGKEIRTYGVALNSGKLIYECSLDGCKNQSNYANYEDLILLERNTQTVRAIEPRSGLERWNFSVAQLNVKFPQSSCHYTDENSLKFNLKAVVPEGLVYAFSESNQLLWKREFNAPIVNVWTWDGRNFQTIDLFTNTQYTWSLNTNNISPALYIGMHNKQLYIHESVILQKFLTSNNRNDRNEITESHSVSRIPWKPYPAKSSSLAIVNIDEKESQNDEYELANQITTTALSVLYGSEYVNGNGYYLYTADVVDKQNSVQCENNITVNVIEESNDRNIDSDEDDTPVQVIIVSLWYWWKEVAVIAITTAFAVNLFLNQHIINRIRLRSESSSKLTGDSVPVREIPAPIPIYIKSHSESDKEFVSRYLNDFDPLHCLGKGGFGVVFEARNKIDECSYAVKRITLPNKPESRERVMREVKALAKLDHRNIVRYFNAWLESPPQEWIDGFDRVWNQEVLSESLDFSTTTKSPPTKKLDSSVVINFSQSDTSKWYNSKDLLKSELNSDSFDIVFENSRTDKTTPSVVKEDKEETNDSSCNVIVKCKAGPDKGSRSQPTVYASGKIFLYIQMQLCRKKSLRDWLKDNVNRSQDEIKIIFEQIVLAVEYVHLKGLIHRDLKPSNIFFSMEGEVKIGDFGLVTGMEECTGENVLVTDKTDSSEKHTQAVGTQLYMSPEQLRGLHYNYKVDIYSLGVILFELLVPFRTVMERNKTLSDLRSNKFPHSFCQNFQKEYLLLILMLSANPEKRPTTMGIRARPPLSNSTETCDYHFELPPRH
ncbi:pancreatic eIF-2alpha kinase [Carabus blaptoides fortunei]